MYILIYSGMGVITNIFFKDLILGVVGKLEILKILFLMIFKNPLI